jgi:hypothetical protein
MTGIVLADNRTSELPGEIYLDSFWQLGCLLDIDTSRRSDTQGLSIELVIPRNKYRSSTQADKYYASEYLPPRKPNMYSITSIKQHSNIQVFFRRNSLSKYSDDAKSQYKRLHGEDIKEYLPEDLAKTLRAFNELLYYPTNNKIVIDTRVNEDVVATFNDLYSKWKEETSVISSTDIFDNIYYQEIIALGKAILPTLIDKLNGSSTFLFLALYRITGENPVQPEHHGDIAAMTGEWKNWWTENKEHYA